MSFTIAREISRREIEAHQKRFVGLTASVPAYKDVDGLHEYCADVRIGVKEGWGLIRDVVISQWALGIVTDMNIPVLCERSEAGQLTIIARSQLRLPDVSYTTYSWQDLDLVWMSGLEQDSDTAGTWRDGFGHAMPDPTAQTGETTSYAWRQSLIEWGGSQFLWGETGWGEATAGWETETEE